MLRIVKENIDLRQSQCGDTLEQSAGTSLSRRKSKRWYRTLDESQIREDFLKHSTVTHRHKTSSPFKLKTKSSPHKEASVQLMNQSCQSDISLDVKAPERILGEIAFQLDKRILSYVFHEQKRLYGFNLRNIKAKIIQVTANPQTGEVDEAFRLQLGQRYADLMEGLKQFEYDTTLHPLFSEYIVNHFGILKLKLGEYNAETLACYSNPDYLKKVIISAGPQEMQKNLLLLLSCLSYMAQNDGKPLFLC